MTGISTALTKMTQAFRGNSVGRRRSKRLCAFVHPWLLSSSRTPFGIANCSLKSPKMYYYFFPQACPSTCVVKGGCAAVTEPPPSLSHDSSEHPQILPVPAGCSFLTGTIPRKLLHAALFVIPNLSSPCFLQCCVSRGVIKAVDQRLVY